MAYQDCVLFDLIFFPDVRLLPYRDDALLRSFSDCELFIQIQIVRFLFSLGVIFGVFKSLSDARSNERSARSEGDKRGDFMSSYPRIVITGGSFAKSLKSNKLSEVLPGSLSCL